MSSLAVAAPASVEAASKPAAIAPPVFGPRIIIGLVGVLLVVLVSGLNDMVTKLQGAGALGTSDSLIYAFGVHINAELPDLKLIVTDLILPGGSSGHKIAEAAWAVRPTLKVLFISGCVDTANGSPERQEQSRLLAKPFTIEQLRASVEHLLNSPAGA